MDLELDFRPFMNEDFRLCSQAIFCPFASASVSSTSSSMHDPFASISPQSTPNELNLDFEDAQHHGVLTPPPSISNKYAYISIKPDTKHMSFSSDGAFPSNPLRKMDMISGYDHMRNIALASRRSISSIAPSSSFPVYKISPQAALQSAPFVMKPTYSLSGLDIADTSASSRYCTNGSPISLPPRKDLSLHDMKSLGLDRRSKSPMVQYYLQAATSPDKIRPQRKRIHGVQKKTTGLRHAEIRAPRKVSDTLTDIASIGVERNAMRKCDYIGCHKAFQRPEHLKRHKQSFHGEGLNNFRCEFCGKDQFNRRDNLNSHRKRHTQLNNRRVKFIPEAVLVIEEECKRRALSRPKAGVL